MSQTHIGTEDLLLGLLREERSIAAEVLAARGLTIEAVREAIVESLGRGEQAEPPGPPSTPANTYRWPQIPFAPSRTVHILHSGMQWPAQPVINHAGRFSARTASLWRRSSSARGTEIAGTSTSHLAGIYGFELKERVDTPEVFIQLLRDKAGLVITREQREIPTLIVR